MNMVLQIRVKGNDFPCGVWGSAPKNMEERERVRIGGVMEVLSFDEDGIMMETTCGLLLLKGAGMHIGKLDLEAGDVVVDGSIDSMTYSDGTLAEKHSILGRLFR